MRAKEPTPAEALGECVLAMLKIMAFVLSALILVELAGGAVG